MGQTRLYLTATKAEADRIFAVLETVFEDDGLPLAVLELDEERDLHEVSLYADGDIEPVEARLKAELTALGLSQPVEREVLPEVDWVARSLEGLKPVRAGRFLVHGAHDRQKRHAGDIAIEIEAGLAFGTGHHAPPPAAWPCWNVSPFARNHATRWILVPAAQCWQSHWPVLLTFRCLPPISILSPLTSLPPMRD